VDLKLDENLGRRVRDLLSRAGHSVATVSDEGMNSAADSDLIEVCRRERRCLVTLDLGFANVLHYDPRRFHGIAVLRPPAKLTAGDLERLADVLSHALEARSLRGKLWIVEPGRIREYQSPDE
jgi:hypothetical protein